MKVRLHPLLTSLAILLLSLALGVCGALFFYHRDEQRYLEESRKTGFTTPDGFGDSGLAYMLSGIGLGLLVGLAVGISAYVVIRQREEEEHYSILSPSRPTQE
jgi:uncharacterized protein YneF (UPF0154 family)